MQILFVISVISMFWRQTAGKFHVTCYVTQQLSNSKSTQAGLSCLTCSASSLQECYATGKVKACWQRQQVCYTEVRYEQPSQVTGLYTLKRVTAGCKQKYACMNDEKQNPVNCYHGAPRSPQRCYRCCRSPECVGMRVERSKPLCFDAMKKFFQRFDANEDGTVHAWEAQLQSEGRKMKSIAFFVTLFAGIKDFKKNGADFEKFQLVMSAWLEEQKLVADRNGNGKISFWEFYLFLRGQKSLSNGGKVTQMEAKKMFTKLARKQLEMDLCQFMDVYSGDVSKKLTVIKCKQRMYIPKYGTRKCTNYDISGSTCSFTCNRGYKLIGPTEITCLRTGQWDQPRGPYCRAIKCPRFKQPNGGLMKCSKSNYAFSQCKTTCDADMGFVMSGSGVSTCTETAKWTKPAACCSRPCPPFATLDLIMIFDSSSSVGEENWKKLLQFGAKIIKSFHISDSTLRVGAFRYNKYVDVRNEIKIGEVNTFEELNKRIHDIPYNGSGTLTGQALQHAYDYSLRAGGNRPNVRDVLLLFTDGVSQDDAVAPARRLKSMGVNVNVVGIKNMRGKLDQKQMEMMVSAPEEEHIMIISGGFDELTEKFVQRISKLVCGNPCKHFLS